MSVAENGALRSLWPCLVDAVEQAVVHHLEISLGQRRCRVESRSVRVGSNVYLG